MLQRVPQSELEAAAQPARPQNTAVVKDPLAPIRARFGKLFVAFLWINVPVAAFSTWVEGNNVFLLTLTAVIFAGVNHVIFALKGAAPIARHLMTVCGIGMTGVFIASAQGTIYQIDMHMYVFAMLAVLAGWTDWRVLPTAVAAVAVHHLSLNILHPDCLFPDGSDYSRVVLHAFVVVVEATFLWQIVSRLETALKSADSRERRAEERALTSARDLAKRHEYEMAGQERVNTLIAEFRDAAKGAGIGVANEIDRMDETVSELATFAERVSETLEDVRVAAADVQEQMRSAGAASQELASSGDEIRRRTGDTAKRAEMVSEQATRSADAVNTLAEAANEMSGIVALIRSVAEQTDLLALNATIEAARAGDAGRGFAVVASEVKGLAEQSAKATETIAEKIAGINASTNRAVAEIERISEMSAAVTSDTAAIATTLDEQAATTEALDFAVQSARTSADRSGRNVDELTSEVSQTNETATIIQEAAGALSAVSQELQDTISTFLSEVAASRRDPDD